MRRLFVCILLVVCSAAFAQETPGLSPKAGALSSNIYTNLFFGFSYQVPRDWEVAFVASDGSCTPECLIFDVRVPGYPKPPRMINISAEAAPNASPERLPSLASTLEQTGKKRLAPVRGIDVAGRKLYRVDYRVPLANTDVFHAFLSMPGKDYVLVFTVQAETRKQVDTMVDELGSALRFVGGTPRTTAGTPAGGTQ
jgi:hypothetical protein